MEEMLPFYTQVIGIGLLWVTVHCIGMCGPIMASLTTSMGVHKAPTARKRAWQAFKGVIAYQSGRALVYLALGASAGFLGSSARGLIRESTQTLGLLIAALLILAGIWKLLPFKSVGTSSIAMAGAKITGRLLRLGRKFGPKRGSGAMLLLGFLLGFLPCMLMFWVLGIAASTASPFHGAMLMLILVVMTTPMLLLAALGSSLPGRMHFLRSDRIIAGALLFSGIWLLMIALAANGWVAHVHFPFELFGEKLVIMLW